VKVETRADIEKAFVAMSRANVNALLVVLSPQTTLHSKTIVDLALKQRLPGMYPTRQFAEEGGLMAYGPLWRPLSPCRRVRRQNSQRSKTRRLAGRTADEVRIYRQFESCKSDELDDPAKRAGAGGSSHSLGVIRKVKGVRRNE